MAADPYTTLGLPRAASLDDVKKAYRTLAKKHHPDLKPGDTANERKFKEISAAYSFLSDTDKKNKFDSGTIDADGNPASPFGGSSDHWQSYGGRRSYAGKKRPYSAGGGEDPFDPNEILSDLFSNFSGKSKRQSSRTEPHKGADVQHTVAVSFLEAALGGKKTINLGHKTIAVNIPAGANDGQMLRLKGQGHTGGAQAGDALIKLSIDKHPFFTRDGNDVSVEVPITLGEAVLGEVITVPTIHGSVSMKIPPASNTGLTLRLRGKGIEGTVGVTGDQYVKLKVVLPETIDPELSTFVRKWAGKHTYKVRNGLGVEG